VETVLKGVVRAERLETPSDFIPAILARVRKEYVQRQYLIREWDDANDFLCKLAMRNGKLLKGGEPDIHSVSINIINDWQRVSLTIQYAKNSISMIATPFAQPYRLILHLKGKLPYFVAPPIEDDDDDEAEEDNETLGLQKDSADAGDDSEVSQVKLYVRAMHVLYCIAGSVRL
jgi:ribosome biogenesis GTPase A